jgi:hypothetical protein|tara:strand:- start:746 stop:2197 length:1452 start_codon:yes stop_codon:yes gene_type:complete
MITKEQKIESWHEARRFWKYPQLAEPVFCELDGIAAMDMHSKTIMVNEDTLEQKIGEDLLSTIYNHEIGHYKLCPYSLSKFLVLMGKADSVLQNISQAKFVENLFADLLINYHVFTRGDKGIVETYNRLNQGKKETWWDVYLSVWGGMIGQDYGTSNVDGVGNMVTSLQNCVYRSKQWPEIIVDFAQFIKPYLKNKDKDCLIDEHGAESFNCNSKELGEARKQLTLREYNRVVAGTGLGTSKKANIDYYNMLASNYSLSLPEHKSFSGNVILESSIDCEPEKAMEADFEYSLARSPKLHPYALSTWKYSQGNGTREEIVRDDLLIVLDSSGSMPDPNEEISIPLVSAHIAKQSAFKANRMVGVVNFATKKCVVNFSHNSQEIDGAMSTYFGGGTTIPGETIQNMIEEHPHPAYLLVITDALIGNFNVAKTHLQRAVQQSRGGTVFLNGNSGNQLGDLGYDVIPSSHNSDLPNLMLGTLRRLYA